MLNKLNNFGNILKEKIISKQEIFDFINSKKAQIKNILGASALATTLSLAPNIASALPTITGKPTSYTYPHISSSVDEVGIENVREFMSFYGINKGEDQKFASKVIELQIQGKIQVSGVLDEKTYNYFLQNKTKKFNQNQKKEAPKNTENLEKHSLNISEKINEIKKYIGPEEYENFKIIFGIKSEKEFINKVLEIQEKGNLKKDGVIGPATLEFIYKNYYSKMNNLPKSVKDRLEVYNFLNNYPNKDEKTVGIFNVIKDKDYYYGINSGYNISGTDLNEKLYKNIDKLSLTPNFNSGNSIQIGKTFDGEHFIAMFVNGKLEVLSYATVGKEGHRSPQNIVENISFTKKGYISGSYPKRDNGQNGGAVMPYAIEVKQETGIYIHMRKFNNTGSWGTAGCYGVPPKYQKVIVDVLNQKGVGNFKVKVGQIY